MANRILICAIVIFALAFARANVYGQIIELEKYYYQVYPVDEVTQRLLDELIDSVLRSVHHSRDSIYVAIDTLKEDTDCFSNHTQVGSVRLKAYMHNAGFKYAGKLTIRHLETSRTATSFSGSSEEGVVSVLGSGILCFEPSMALVQKFSFAKVLKYRTTYENYLPDKDTTKSFWDSTAKPILVTLGAAAVIALFFLIRG